MLIESGYVVKDLDTLTFSISRSGIWAVADTDSYTFRQDVVAVSVWLLAYKWPDNTMQENFTLFHSYLPLYPGQLTILVHFIHTGIASCTCALWQSDLTFCLTHHDVCL